MVFFCPKTLLQRSFDPNQSKKKNHAYKNQGWDPSIKSTRQMKAEADTTQRKNKSKQSTKISLNPCANRTHGYEMTINDNK
jgi:hypothetical protein